MKNSLKKTKLIILSIFLIVIGITVFYIYQFLQEIKAECELVDEFYIENYKIEKLRCLGYAGPHWYPFNLYKDGKEMEVTSIKFDSCRVEFVAHGSKDHYTFDKCQQSVEIQKPKKDIISLNQIDSAFMKNLSINDEIKLNKKQIEYFTNKWNTSKVDGYSTDSLLYYDPPDYSIQIFTQTDTLNFITGRFVIKNINDSWTYNFLDEDEPRAKTEKFTQFWNMK